MSAAVLAELRPLVVAYARRRGLQPADAEDLAQETLLRVVRGRYEDRGQADRWVLTIARHALVDRARAAHVRRPAEPLCVDVADPAPGPEALAVLASEAAAVDRCLGRLPARQQAVLRCRLDGLSFAEVGVRLGIGEGTARTTHHRALRSLRRQCRHNAGGVR